MIKLHMHPMSQFAQRVRIALLEKGVTDWEVSVLAMQEGAHRKPEYLRISPYGRVPAVEVDGVPIYESTAILELLEELHPTPALMPDTPVDRARVRMLVKACDLYFARHAGAIVFPKRFLPEERWRHEEMDAARQQIEKHFEVLDRTVGDREHVVGDRLTLVEVCYAPWLQWVPMTGAAVPPNVDRWARALLARPSVVETRPPDAPAWPD